MKFNKLFSALPVIKGKAEGEYCESELLKNISWMRTEKGKTVRKPCPFGFSGESLRYYLLLIHFPIVMLLV